MTTAAKPETKQAEILSSRLDQLNAHYSMGWIVPAQYEAQSQDLIGKIWAANHE